jgi:hypothetical protein
LIRGAAARKSNQYNWSAYTPYGFSKVLMQLKAFASFARKVNKNATCGFNTY